MLVDGSHVGFVNDEGGCEPTVRVEEKGIVGTYHVVENRLDDVVIVCGHGIDL